MEKTQKISTLPCTKVERSTYQNQVEKILILHLNIFFVPQILVLLRRPGSVELMMLG